MKLLILVANSNFYPSNIMIPFLRKTWGNDDRVKVIYYQGGSEENYLDGDKLYLDAGTSIDDTCEKLLAALEWINKNEQFDIIFRATTTTYLDIDNILKFLYQNKSENLYAGILDYYPPIPDDKIKKTRFLSGAGYFISKDIVSLLLLNRSKVDKNLWDDVAVGKFLIEDKKISHTKGYRQDFYDGYPLMKDIDIKNYHYRFSSGKNFYPRYLEIITLLSLHFRTNLIKNNRKVSIAIFLLFDLIFYLVYEIFKIFNPLYISLLLKNLNRLKNKLIVSIIKSNKYTLNFFRKLKRFLNFKNFK